MLSPAFESSRARVARRALAAFALFVLSVALVVVVRGPGAGHGVAGPAAVVAVLTVASLVLAAIAAFVHSLRVPVVPRFAVVLALAYHAGFGPALMLTRAIDPVSRNDDLFMRLWPHVVHAINSLE